MKRRRKAFHDIIYGKKPKRKKPRCVLGSSTSLHFRLSSAVDTNTISSHSRPSSEVDPDTTTLHSRSSSTIDIATTSLHSRPPSTADTGTTSSHSRSSSTIDTDTSSLHSRPSSTIVSSTSSLHSRSSSTIDSGTSSLHSRPSSTIDSGTSSLHSLLSSTIDSFVKSSHDIASLVKLLFIKHDNYPLVYQFYADCLSASAHLMHLEQWNSLNALFCGGKMLNREWKSLSYKMNLNINTSSLSQFDIRLPAMKYTLYHARKGNIDIETAKSQPVYNNIFEQAINRRKGKKKLCDSRIYVRKLFDI